MFKKILIANRGEIALRVICACRELGIETVAVYSEPDENSLHVRFADDAVCIGPAASRDSYLNVPAIISAAEITGADAIHPGYGFLSESPYMAEVCEACHIKFIGPSANVIRLLGDKARARRVMKKAGVPVLPGSDGPVDSEERGLKIAKDMGLPVIIKAAAGGGGRGMRIVRTMDELGPSLKTAQREAQAAFGVGDVYIEKYIDAPRHIEFQILGDHHGNVVHLGERECSIQRRHQKLIEEAPSVALSEKVRRKLGNTVVDAAREVQYTNAGTFEFLMDSSGNIFFIEANTRLQVEHGVTELVTGLDIVKLQIQIAAGHKLPFKQSDIVIRGHAMECRINAEHPETFCPSPGQIHAFSVGGGPGVRVDTFAHSECTVSPYYDSLVAKLMTPEAFIAFLKTGWPTAAFPDGGPPGIVGISSDSFGTAWQTFANSEYGFGRFDVTVPITAPPERQFNLRFRLSQWRWRLKAIGLPASVQDRFADELIKSVKITSPPP
jgi:acetyl-CoA carboxylase biotin carboxylase subunit